MDDEYSRHVGPGRYHGQQGGNHGHRTYHHHYDDEEDDEEDEEYQSNNMMARLQFYLQHLVPEDQRADLLNNLAAAGVHVTYTGDQSNDGTNAATISANQQMLSMFGDDEDDDDDEDEEEVEEEEESSSGEEDFRDARSGVSSDSSDESMEYSEAVALPPPVPAGSGDDAMDLQQYQSDLLRFNQQLNAVISRTPTPGDAAVEQQPMEEAEDEY